ncbi:DUF6458 family protein, partial [Agrococcus casei]|uniref:DUF6458 family protein n=1 Tax=Agrococcus casei TaxID=343512 RepID=UPI003F918D4D
VVAKGIIMSMGLGIALFVIGAILVWALNIDVQGVDINMIGYILMGAGVIIFLIGLVMLFRRRSVTTTQRTAVDDVTGERITRTDQRDDI